MLSLSKHLDLNTKKILSWQRCFDKLSMTF